MKREDLSPTQRRRQLEYANQLAELAVSAPDDETKRFVYVAVNAIRKRAGWTKQEKYEEIWRVIQIGASTHAELIRETGFHRDDVFEIVGLLAKEGLVDLKPMSLTGGAGRPAVCIFPK